MRSSLKKEYTGVQGRAAVREVHGLRSHIIVGMGAIIVGFCDSSESLYLRIHLEPLRP